MQQCGGDICNDDESADLWVQKIFHPLQYSRRVGDDDSYPRINELGNRIDKAMKCGQELAYLMEKEDLELALFIRKKNVLAEELI